MIQLRLKLVSKKRNKFGKVMYPVVIFFLIITLISWYITLRGLISGGFGGVIILIIFLPISFLLTVITLSLFGSYMVGGKKKQRKYESNVEIVYEE